MVKKWKVIQDPHADLDQQQNLIASRRVTPCPCLPCLIDVRYRARSWVVLLTDRTNDRRNEQKHNSANLGGVITLQHDRDTVARVCGHLEPEAFRAYIAKLKCAIIFLGVGRVLIILSLARKGVHQSVQRYAKYEGRSINNLQNGVIVLIFKMKIPKCTFCG